MEEQLESCQELSSLEFFHMNLGASKLAAAWHSPVLRRSTDCSTSMNNAPYKQHSSAPWKRAARGSSRQNSECFFLLLGHLSSSSESPLEFTCQAALGQISLYGSAVELYPGTPEYSRA